MISGQYNGMGSWLDDLANETGVHPTQIWDSLKTGGKELVTKDLPAAAGKALQEKVASTAAPVVQSVAEKKAETVISKGNIALMAAIGGVAGVLISGGTWQRRAIGGSVGAILGGLAGLKIGLVSE